jgi:hypothetical protein
MIKRVLTTLVDLLWPKLEPLIQHAVDELIEAAKADMHEAVQIVTTKAMADLDETTDQVVARVVPDVNGLAGKIIDGLLERLPKLPRLF